MFPTENKSIKNNSHVTILNLNEALSRKCKIGSPSDSKSTQSTSTSSGRSTVCFSESIQVAEPTIRRCDYTVHECKATWYDLQEIRALAFKRRRVIKLMEQGGSVPEYTRGLEFKTKEGKKRRCLAILSAVSAVLNEQEDQQDASWECLPDPEALANVYSMHTFQSQLEARERAEQDRQEAVSSLLQ